MAEFKLTKQKMTWAQGFQLTTNDVLKGLGVELVGTRSTDPANVVMVDISQVRVQMPGVYPVILSSQDAHDQSGYVEIVPNDQKETNQKKHKRGLITGIVIVAVLLIGTAFAANSCANKQAQQNQQAAQVKQNTDDVNNLQNDNQKLQNQVAQLKQAVKDSNNNAEMQNKLNNLRAQNNDLMARNSQDQNLVNQLKEMNAKIDQMNNNPENAANRLQDYTNQLAQNNDLLAQIKQSIDNLVQQFQNIGK